METVALQNESLIHRVRTIWSTFQLSLGIPAIDRQHLWLIAILVNLESSLEDPEGMSDFAFGKALASAVDYTLEHFTLEEKLIRAMDYPDAEEHESRHTRFIAGLKRRAREKGRGDEEAPVKLLKNLKQWLYTHIQNEDRKYRDFAAERGLDLEILMARVLEDTSLEFTTGQEALYSSVAGELLESPDLDENILARVASIWNKYNLRIGVPIIDMQHLWLIRQIVELDSVSRSKSDTRLAGFNRTVITAIEYIKEHFTTEEMLMEHFQFTDRENHIRQHRHFVEMVQHRNRQRKDEDMTAIPGLLQDLKEWLITHIAVEDKKLYYHLRKSETEVANVTKQWVQKKNIVIRKGFLDLYRPIVQLHL